MEAAGAVTDPTTPEDDDLGSQLRSTVARLYRRFRNERPEGTLGDAALEVLSRLEKNGPQTLTQLSAHDRIAPASMSQSVNRLTSAGYAIRAADPHDRRKVLISATQEGAEVALAARIRRTTWLGAQLDELSPEDQRVIKRACVLLAAIADS